MADRAAPGVAELCAAMLGAGDPVSLVATGRSMVPTIRDGETIVVEAVAAEAIKPGDVVVVRTAGGIRAHRMRSLQHGECGAPLLVCRGDNAGADDPPVPLEAVLGRVVAVQRGGRRRAVDAVGVRVARVLSRVRRTAAGVVGRRGVILVHMRRLRTGARRFR